MLEAFKVAAEKGDAIAQFNLGLSYYHGKGVLQDYAQAVYWYRKAAEQGHPDAKEILEKDFGIEL